MFRKEILKTFGSAFLVPLDINGLNILNSVKPRAMKYHWQYMELLSSLRFSWRRTKLFLILNLFIAKRDTLETLGISDILWLSWCFSILYSSPFYLAATQSHSVILMVWALFVIVEGLLISRGCKYIFWPWLFLLQNRQE